MGRIEPLWAIWTALINLLSLQHIFLLSLSLFQYSFLSGTVSSQCGSVSQGRTPRAAFKVSLIYQPMQKMCECIHI